MPGRGRPRKQAQPETIEGFYEQIADDLAPAPEPKPQRAAKAPARKPGALGRRFLSLAEDGVRGATASVAGEHFAMTEDEAQSVVRPVKSIFERHVKVAVKLNPDVEDALEIASAIAVWIIRLIKANLEARKQLAQQQARARQQGAAAFGVAPDAHVIYAPPRRSPAPSSPVAGEAGASPNGRMQLGEDMYAAPAEAYPHLLREMPGDMGLGSLGN